MESDQSSAEVPHRLGIDSMSLVRMTESCRFIGSEDMSTGVLRGGCPPQAPHIRT